MACSARNLKPILHFALGLRFGNFVGKNVSKNVSKNVRKTQQALIFTQHIV